MSKIKLLLDVASDLRALAGSVQAVVDAMSGNEPADATQPETAVPEPKPEGKPVTLEQVRAVLAQKSVQGHTAQVQALIHKRGAEKLSQMEPAEYASLLAEAEELQ